MTDRELGELLDSKIREFLVKELAGLEENSPANLFARKVLDDVMQYHKIPYHIEGEENVKEITFEEFVKNVKCELAKIHIPWVDQEIERVRRRLEQ